MAKSMYPWIEPEEPAAPDHGDECICKGNWRAIVKDYAPKIGQRLKDTDGAEWCFFGLVHADDDYYYGLWRKGEDGMRLVSCCVALEMFYEPTIAANQHGDE